MFITLCVCKVVIRIGFVHRVPYHIKLVHIFIVWHKMASCHGHTFRITDPLCGLSTDYRWFLHRTVCHRRLLMVSLLLTGAHFTNDFSVVIQISLKLFLPQLQCREPYHYKILYMPRQHSCRGMCKLSQRPFFYNLDDNRTKFPSNLNYNWKIVHEMGPWSVKLDIV